MDLRSSSAAACEKSDYRLSIATYMLIASAGLEMQVNPAPNAPSSNSASRRSKYFLLSNTYSPLTADRMERLRAFKLVTRRQTGYLYDFLYHRALSSEDLLLLGNVPDAMACPHSHYLAVPLLIVPFLKFFELCRCTHAIFKFCFTFREQSQCEICAR